MTPMSQSAKACISRDQRDNISGYQVSAFFYSPAHRAQFSHAHHRTAQTRAVLGGHIYILVSQRELIEMICIQRPCFAIKPHHFFSDLT